MTTFELTDQECKAFILLAKAKAWDIRGGSVTIHFDSSGTPAKIETRTITLSTPVDSGVDKQPIVSY